LSKKPNIRTIACIKRIAYPIQPFGPSATPSEGANEIMRRMVANLSTAKKVWNAFIDVGEWNGRKA
jgi:hypothetical protein